MPNQISNRARAARYLAIAALAVTVLTPFAPSLAAAAVTDEPQATVKFADLDLASDSGAATLLRRIEAAAQQVCGNPHAIQPLERLVRIQQCNARAIERAVTNVGAPKVMLAYRSRHWGPSAG
ncbi:MAG TPA: UrcA family protein [Steroidobacteraceae bacterium]|jgi:UrcA family protein